MFYINLWVEFRFSWIVDHWSIVSSGTHSLYNSWIGISEAGAGRAAKAPYCIRGMSGDGRLRAGVGIALS